VVKVYHKKKLLIEVTKADASAFIRIAKAKGGRVKFDDNSVTIQNAVALKVAEEEFWELTDP